MNTVALESNRAGDQPKILVVDNDEAVRTTLATVLRASQFTVTAAASVANALQLISSEHFDVLLTDLHMPGAGDGFTLVSAMRHTNPDAITLVFTGYPALEEAMNAILLQADEILVKPMAVPALVALIRDRLQKRGKRKVTHIERVSTILERDALLTIDDWLVRVEREDELTCVPLGKEQRTGHLPKLLQELIYRLRVPRSLGTKQVSEAAAEHGRNRHTQGYTIAMIVEESRILQVSIFQTLQHNLTTVDFSLLLPDVMTTADEVDSQLKQTIISFAQRSTMARIA